MLIFVHSRETDSRLTKGVKPVADTCIDRSLIQPEGFFPDWSMQDELFSPAHFVPLDSSNRAS